MNTVEWKKYYKAVFVKELETALLLKESYSLPDGGLDKENNEKQMCMQYASLFNCACTLLKYYLAYNGLFQFENREIIKEAFYIEMIDEGELWIDTASLVEVIETYGYEEVKELVLSCYNNEYFQIFETLKNKFESLVNDDE